MGCAFFGGDIFRFYEVCHSDVETAGYHIFNMPDYDFLIYIIFAVWNLPLWIARKVAHINIWESALAIAWAKTIVLLFTLLTIKAVVDICKTLKLEEGNRRDVVLLFATSSILYMSVFVTSQYDVIYLDMTGIIGEAAAGDRVAYVKRTVVRELKEQYPQMEVVEGFVPTLANAVEITGNKFIMIIDEWDAPIREAKEHPDLQRKYLEFLRSLFKNSGMTDKNICGGIYDRYPAH